MSRFDVRKILSSLTESGSTVVLSVGGLGAATWLVGASIYTVEAGHIAIKYNRFSGIGSETYREGVHFRIPWLDRPILFDVRSKPHTMAALTGSRDLQMVNVSLRALSRPSQHRLPEIYRVLGPDYDEKVLPSIVNEVLKSVVAQYNAAQLIQERERVSQTIRQRLSQRALDFNIELDDVAITHLSFSPEYEKAVESKQVALQQSEKAKYTVLRAMEEKKQTILHAQGEQKAAELIGNAIRDNPGFIDLRRIAVAKEIAAMLARSSNRMVLNAEGLLLDLAPKGAILSEASKQGDAAADCGSSERDDSNKTPSSSVVPSSRVPTWLTRFVSRFW
eukprot:TRINITY_DN45494_c0_g1_i1.p1 TRINITY_DN45494_c0_g1~~TRINITY_DN45494_c0_g1_i1.p1  ORF type:complete len:334 (+),score=47.54 TRINITY_DN45494_c0_g1_i1:64-1065(+)